MDQMVGDREETWSCPLRVTQPGLGVRQEHVLEVLVCQHKHLLLPAGAGLHPAQEAGTSWHHLKISSECANEFLNLNKMYKVIRS